MQGGKGDSAGVALILVLMVIAICSALTIFLGSSTYFNARVHDDFIKRVQAEYVLKSALNVARTLIAQSRGDSDPPKNGWGPLVAGMDFSGDIIGIEDPNVVIGLEINSVDSKLTLRKLYDHSRGVTGGAHTLFLKWRDSFVRLFQGLGFDNDNETDSKGPFRGKVFNSQELVANLIDYMDSDEASYDDQGFAGGIESSLPKGTFANQNMIHSLSELESIPGFTSGRIRKLTPFITTEPVDQANVNLISSRVLMAIAPELSQQSADEIVNHARGPDGPFETFTFSNLLSPYFKDFNEISRMITVRSSYLQVVARVQYGTSKYFLRATLDKSLLGSSSDPSEDGLPEVIKLELFG
jgi:type II secretory pathway component PulK